MEPSKKRIEYVDALRGFTMYLVVYSHIWTFGYHADSINSFDHILVNFFLVLFFFISGFCAYKKGSDIWNFTKVGEMLKKKFVQLMIPTLVFFSVLCYWRGRNFMSYLDVATAEYWFTFELFLFFCFYYVSMILIRRLNDVQQSIALIIIAFLLYLLSFSHVLIERSEVGASLFHYLGIDNWREYIFFIFGVLVRKHFESFKKLTDCSYVMACFILLFFFMIFCADKIEFPMWKPIRMLIYGGVSIVVIFSFFRKYENSFHSDHKFGYCMQYIGRRTLDVYMIHYFFLPRNLTFMGKYFLDYSNPAIEFFVTTLLSLLAIFISIVVGNILRLSPSLSHFLFGKK